MKLAIYQVDAFTVKLFGGNPAAVIPLNEWLDDSIMQNIAMENNLSETAFFVKTGERYHIRWMTPEIEVPLCGHATLASSYVIFNFLEPDAETLRFNSKSGELIVTRQSDLISMDFPANVPVPADSNSALAEALGAEPTELLINESHLAVFESESDVKNLSPDFGKLKEIDNFGVIATAPGDSCDFVSRFFIPASGINEDPVTGYAHTLLIPYWSKRLGKTMLRARQISKRGGVLTCENLDNRVKISGQALLYLKGEINI